MKDLKRLLLLILVLSLAAFAAVGLTGCDGDVPDNKNPEDDIPLDGLVLIHENEAKFNIITAQGAGSAGIRAANDLYKLFTDKLGVAEVNAPIPDSDVESLWNCEIIIGTDCRNRGDECSVDAREIGHLGYVIKVVGERVIIAGGSPAKTREAVNIFISKYLGVTDTTEALSNIALSTTLNETVYTDYNIDSLKIGDNDISMYKVVCDTSDENICPTITTTFTESVSMLTGKYIEVVDQSVAQDVTHKIIFRKLPVSHDANGNRTYADGFYIRVEGNDLIFECEYYNAFVKFYDSFMEEYVLTKSGDVVIPKDLNITKCASIVKYSDFGAFGNDTEDDFSYMLDAHEYANLGGQKVVADGEVYYIGIGGTQIPIRTNVDFGTARFVIDDNAKGINRKKHIFIIEREHKNKTVFFGVDHPTNTALKKLETTSLPWLDEHLDYDSLVLVNTAHMDYIRYGANGNLGRTRCDVLLVDKDGNIDESTPVTNDYEFVGQVNIFRVDDEPITVNGGFFENICARSGCEHNNKWGCYKGRTENYCRSNVYQSVSRGFRIERANCIITNVDHKVVDEPQDGSYPYYGFFLFYNAHNVTVKDCNLTGHKYYVEYKTNDYGQTNWVPMGTYDLVCEYSNEIHFENITQTNGKNDIGDSGYWGIMSSNGSKNLHFKSCIISRIDAHCGFWNMTVEDTVIGHTFNVIGGGNLTVKNSQRRVGQSFISLRGDYGATFDGDLVIENCLLDGIKSYNSVWGKYENKPTSRPSSREPIGYIISPGFDTTSKYLNWDFGYKCYLPHTVTITNFQSNTSYLYIYNSVGDSAFSAKYPNQYQITRKITYIRDTTVALPTFLKAGSIKTNISIAPSGCSKLNSIPYESKKIQ